MNFINLVGGLGGALGLGALAASVPLIIHILNRRRFRVIEWAAMRFLLDAQKENRRRVMLEQLILLLLRMLLAALIVWMILRPLLPREGAGRLIGGKTDHLWIIDDSRSMLATSAGASLIERSRSLLLEFSDHLADLGGADSLTVLRSSRPDQPDLLRQPVTARSVQEQLSNLAASMACTDGRANLAASLAAAVQLARENPGSSPVFTIVGDSCLADFRDPTSGGENPELLEAALAAAELGELRIVDLSASGSRENLGVTSLEIVEGNVIAAAPVSLRVTVQNFGTREARDVELAVSSESSSRNLKPIESIPAGAIETIEIPFAFSKPGSHMVSVSISGDRFPADDQGSLAVDVLEGLDVLLVDGEGGDAADAGVTEGDRARGSETWFLRRALAPGGRTRSGIRVQAASEERFSAMEFQGFSCIVLANMFKIDPAKVQALYGFVEQGGGLIVFPGDQTDADLFQRDFHRDGGGLSPAALGAMQGNPTGDEFATFAKAADHPVTALFTGEDNPFASPVKLYAWFELLPTPDSKVLLESGVGRGGVVEGTGVPILVERAHGKGRVLLFGIPADDEWSNWPGEPSYLVTMQEAIHYVAPRRSASNNLALGSRVVRPIDPSEFDVHARLIPPDIRGAALEQTLVASKVDEHPLAFDLGTLDRAGAYRLELARRSGGTTAEFLSVAGSPEEGDQRRADEIALTNLLPEVELSYIADPAQLLEVDSDADRAELWRPLAMLALAFLLVETVLAWRFGHHTGSLAA